MITYDLYVLIGVESQTSKVVIKSHDTGVNLRIFPEIMSYVSIGRSRKVPYYIPGGALAILKIAKPDKKYVIIDNKEIMTTDILFELPPQAFTVAGISKAEVSIYNAEGKRLTTETFEIEIPEECICHCNLKSEDYVCIVAEQIVNAAKNAVDDKLDANQGIENAGRAMVVGNDGILRPGDYAGSGGGSGSGADGFSPIAKVEQTTTGAKITITDKTGTTTATVKNGKDGEDGTPGDPGKSAYAYAKDGGYTGTEEEFAQKLARETITPGIENAGKLLYVDESGNGSFLQLGDGLEIRNGRLCITGTVTPDEPAEAIAFTQTGENSVTVSGVVFEQQEDGTVLWGGATFTPGEENSVVIK